MEILEAFQVQLETQRLQALGLVEGWSAERLAFSSSGGQWSALQVFDHIVRSESGIQAAVRAGLQAPHSIGVRDRLGVLFIDRIFRSERQVKAPASATSIQPGTDLNLQEICDRWVMCRRELGAILSAVSPGQMSGGVFRHPVAGWMTLPQVLRFFEVHVLHHTYQLNRIALASEHLRAAQPSSAPSV